MITFKCLECGQTLRIEEKYAGRKAKCPKCNTACVVPAESKNDSKTLIKFFCSDCGHNINAPSHYAGKKCK